MARKTPSQPDQLPPAVRVGAMPELKVYQISESELDQLASGSPGQIHLSFALAMLPAALTILITLQTVEIGNDRIYSTYLIALGLLAGQGLYHLARWWFAGSSLTFLVAEIRARIPDKSGILEQVTGQMDSPAPG